MMRLFLHMLILQDQMLAGLGLKALNNPFASKIIIEMSTKRKIGLNFDIKQLFGTIYAVF
jgi:hypothetical protein